MAKCKVGKVKRTISVCLPKKRKAAPKKAAPKKAAKAVRGKFKGGYEPMTVKKFFGIKDRPKGAKGWQAAKPCDSFDWVTNEKGHSTLADLDTKTCKPLPCDVKKAVAVAKRLKSANDLHNVKNLRVLRPCEKDSARLHPGATKATAKAVKAAIPVKVKKEEASFFKGRVWD